MPDPVAIILALEGLAKNLIESIKDRKSASKAQEILRLVGELQSEYFALKQHILKVEAENAEMKLRVAALASSHAQKQQDDATVVIDLDEPSVRMLQHLSRCGHRAQKPHQLAQALGLTMTRARYYADTLVGGQYIHAQLYANGAVEYELAERGREFLVARNLDV